MKIGKVCLKHPELKGLRHNGGNCKLCACERHKGYYQTNKEKFRQHNKTYREKHREVLNMAAKEWQSKNRDRLWSNNLKRLGFTIPIYKQFIEEQGNKCAICEVPFDTIPRKQVHADHCHETLTPRGILCHRCNTGLGAFRDDISLLGKAINYIEKYKEEVND